MSSTINTDKLDAADKLEATTEAAEQDTSFETRVLSSDELEDMVESIMVMSGSKKRFPRRDTLYATPAKRIRDGVKPVLQVPINGIPQPPAYHWTELIFLEEPITPTSLCLKIVYSVEEIHDMIVAMLVEFGGVLPPARNADAVDAVNSINERANALRSSNPKPLS